MRPLIPVPSKGHSLRATWGAQVANRVNELCAMAPSGVLQREGFGGIGAQPLPANLRDRNGGAAARPMPFDLKGEVETSPDGTQKRLVVKWYYGLGDSDVNASAWWNYWRLTSPSFSFPAIDGLGWVTVFTGEWMAVGSFSDAETIEMWYRLQVQPNWSGGSPTFTVVGSWEVIPSSEHDLSELSLDPTAVAQTVVSYVVLGRVAAGSSGVRVSQAFHGALHLNDLLCLGGDGGGSGGDATNGTNYPMPFQYKRTDSDDGEGNITSTYLIANNRFYWDGEYHSLSDYTPPGTGTVWLIAAKSGSGAGSWAFRLSDTQGSAASGEQSFKLYDFVSNQIAMDYRTTTLTFGPGPRDYLALENRNSTAAASKKIELDATLNNPQVSVSGNNGDSYLSDYELHMQDETGGEVTIAANGGSHKIDLQSADATQDDVKIVECTYYDGASPTPKKVNIPASLAMTLVAVPNVAVVTGVSFKIENSKLIATIDKQNLRTGATSTADVDVCKVHDLTVVTETEYTSPNFYQYAQTVTVIGEAPATTPSPSTIFTTTPLSSES